MLVLKTSNFQGATIRPIVPRHKQSMVFIVHHYIFLRAPVQKSIELVSTFFRWKPWKPNVKFEKENRQNPLNTISIVYFLQSRLFTEKCSRTGTIHPGIFRGRALWADSISPPMNTIASRERFKPIRIGENLVLNYKGWYSVSPRMNTITSRDQFKPITTGEILVVNYDGWSQLSAYEHHRVTWSS